MIVTIVTFHLKRPASLEEMTKVFQGTAPKYQNMAGLLRKNYWTSEDGLRAGGIYVWTSKADADRVYTPEWKKFVESKYGAPPVIEYLHSPVMVDNREGTISVAAA
jgi:putative monooxygenase ydhR